MSEKEQLKLVICQLEYPAKCEKVQCTLFSVHGNSMKVCKDCEDCPYGSTMIFELKDETEDEK